MGKPGKAYTFSITYPVHDRLDIPTQIFAIFVLH
jgi:hypothetical protein